MKHSKPTRTRREFLTDAFCGFGSLAFAAMLGEEARAAAPNARAKSVIFLFMAGGPSQLELFTPKPKLQELDGQVIPESFVANKRFAFIKGDAKLQGTKRRFAQHGESGQTISECLPHLAEVVDDIAIVKSMATDAFNHAPGQIFMNTGSQQFGRPSMGAWTTYGLGSESQDLPAFVVFSTGSIGPSGGASNWGNGFLPSVHQGVMFRSVGDPVLYLSNPKGVDKKIQDDSLATIKKLNQRHLDVVGDPEIATRINSFELAHRMQSAAPELMDVSKESKETLAMYGAEPGKGTFANACLLARRLVEKGVRFVEIFHESWDQHGNLVADLKKNCLRTDQASAALVKDLKQRGLLEDTLVIWGGEFGRTPMVQGGDDGRDHHPNCFTMWMAGGGIKPGITLGESDEFGFNASRDRVHVHDLHATLLHLLGFDHTKLTYRFQGRDFRLTDVEGEVVENICA